MSKETFIVLTVQEEDVCCPSDSVMWTEMETLADERSWM